MLKARCDFQSRGASGGQFDSHNSVSGCAQSGAAAAVCRTLSQWSCDDWSNVKGAELLSKLRRKALKVCREVFTPASFVIIIVMTELWVRL